MDRSLWAANVGRPEEEDVPRHEEDLAVKGAIDSGVEVAKALNPQGDEQGPGSVGAPGYC